MLYLLMHGDTLHGPMDEYRLRESEKGNLKRLDCTINNNYSLHSGNIKFNFFFKTLAL